MQQHYITNDLIYRLTVISKYQNKQGVIPSFIFGNFALLFSITSEFITTQSEKLVLHLAWFFVHVLIAQWLLYFVHPRNRCLPLQKRAH